MVIETTATTLEDDLTIAEGGDDIVDGQIRAPRKGRMVKPVGEAAAEYFEWHEKREEQRKRRAQRLAESGETPPAASRKTAPPIDENARTAVAQFVSHVTPSLPVAALTPRDMAAFQETIGANATDVAARLIPVKEFLRFCWKNCGYTDANLGNHLRVKSAAAPIQIEYEEAERFEMTADGLAQLKEELDLRKKELQAATQAVAQALEGRRLRKNAPLDAARENQERLNSRINELEYQIAHAVISANQATGRAHLGSTVGVRRLDNGDADVILFTLVGPAEINAEQRRISIESPVGKGLVDTTVGEIIEVEVPSGMRRYEVVSVDG